MDVAVLRNEINGEVLEEFDAGYQLALNGMLWNRLKADRRPALIVCAQNEKDVAKAVRFADANHQRVVARGGGHSWCGLAVRSGGMLIDLARLNKVTVEPGLMRATVQPFVSNRDVIAHLEPHGLAFPTGHCPQVKLSGYLLSGGIGWNSGFWGPACHSVEAIDVVTAQGELVRVSDYSHPELFWAARGGDAGFPGIAVCYHLRLYRMPETICESSYNHPLEHIREIGDWVQDVAQRLPSWVELTLFMLSAPAKLAERCASMNRKVCKITATAFANDSVAAANALELLEACPLRKWCLAAEPHQATSFSGLFDGASAAWPEKLRNRVETMWSNSSQGEMLLAARDHFITTPSATILILIAMYPGWDNRVPGATDTAFSMTGKEYGGLWTMWSDSADDIANCQWHDKMMSILKPFAIGHYLGETDIVEDSGRAAKCFAKSHWQQLQRVRSEFDPNGLFQGFEGGLRTFQSSL
jgi:FAD/FMN-containing dehydrogenase